MFLFFFQFIFIFFTVIMDMSCQLHKQWSAFTTLQSCCCIFYVLLFPSFIFKSDARWQKIITPLKRLQSNEPLMKIQGVERRDICVEM